MNDTKMPDFNTYLNVFIEKVLIINSFLVSINLDI